ncbi:MAG: ergothioneine biosynthesis protein EgtB [Bacteroidota bacterium]
MILEKTKLGEKFDAVRKQSTKLCKPLKTEDYVVQPIVDVSPPKWHLGHTTWFFECFVLAPNKANYKVYDPDFNYIFNSYYETVGERVLRPNRGFLTRPTVEEVYAYRQYVDEQMAELIDQNEVPAELATLIELGLQHEQQHQELLLYDIKYILGRNPLFPAYLDEANIAAVSAPDDLAFLEIPEGVYSVGFEEQGFCFDNEQSRHKVYLNDYGIGNRLMTNGEFLEFMESGAYEKFNLWLSEGWDWVKNNEANSPFHWHQIDGNWYQYNLRGGLEKIDPHAPVTHVSYYEADAFARWKGLRLPTEFEWEVAFSHYPQQTDSANFVESEKYAPMPQVAGSNQFYGDSWEWTSSAYSPYPGYNPPGGAIGEYNGKFMINQMVLKGGSCATPKDHIRPTYRNFFHPHLRWFFTGIRLAKSI